MRKQIQAAAPGNQPILLTGPPGCCAETVAQSIHSRSPQSAQTFTPFDLNCNSSAAVEEQFLNATASGSVTGTVYLNAVDKLSQNGQRLMLDRLAGRHTRYIVTIHADLTAMSRRNLFGKELFRALSNYELAIPTLGDRPQDLAELIVVILAGMEDPGAKQLRLSTSALECLHKYHWLNDIQELRELLSTMAKQYPNANITAAQLPTRFQHVRATLLPSTTELLAESIRLPEAGISLKTYLATLEQKLIQQALQDSNRVVARAADRLQIRRTTLVEKMRKYGISRVQ